MRDLRKLKEYKQMTPYMATGLAEGFEETDNELEILCAWQYLHDSGLAYQLQGWFGRNAQRLLEDEIIQK
jgi:hypothetical protein